MRQFLQRPGRLRRHRWASWEGNGDRCGQLDSFGRLGCQGELNVRVESSFRHGQPVVADPLDLARTLEESIEGPDADIIYGPMLPAMLGPDLIATEQGRAVMERYWSAR